MADGTGFEMVDDLIAQLARDGSSFASSTSPQYRIESYERGRRLRIANVKSSRWIDLEDVRACWETFERLLKIDSDDVLEPGRASAFMLALFQQLPCVVEAPDGTLAFA